MVLIEARSPKSLLFVGQNISGLSINLTLIPVRDASVPAAFWLSLPIRVPTVLELYNLETHQKKAGADYHRLKKMVKRSIEQNNEFRNFEARKNQGTKQCGQRTLGDCWQWEFNGQCSRGDNCSFRHDVNKRAK